MDWVLWLAELKTYNRVRHNFNQV